MERREDHQLAIVVAAATVAVVAIWVASIVAVRQIMIGKGRVPGWWALATLLLGPVVLVPAVLVPRSSTATHQ